MAGSRRYASHMKAAFNAVAIGQRGAHMTIHSIKGKTLLIAGGAKNPGDRIARDLAGHGARLAYRRAAAVRQSPLASTVLTELPVPSPAKAVS